ncbi:hypothetical protein [Planomicrobium okeanokoites]|uniref:hypothetical protein n=1 Tax=Planomicrobium okeanokoites TaxID=244 RepID=UPI00248F57A3|nr:hypothetical protein [Planomicrobium okeanokoites]
MNSNWIEIIYKMDKKSSSAKDYSKEPLAAACITKRAALVCSVVNRFIQEHLGKKGV